MKEFIVINTNGELHIHNKDIKECHRYSAKTLLVITENNNLYKELYKENDDLIIVSVNGNSNKLMTWANTILGRKTNGGKK